MYSKGILVHVVKWNSFPRALDPPSYIFLMQSYSGLNLLMVLHKGPLAHKVLGGRAPFFIVLLKGVSNDKNAQKQIDNLTKEVLTKLI